MADDSRLSYAELLVENAALRTQAQVCHSRVRLAHRDAMAVMEGMIEAAYGIPMIHLEHYGPLLLAVQRLVASLAETGGGAC